MYVLQSTTVIINSPSPFPDAELSRCKFFNHTMLISTFHWSFSHSYLNVQNKIALGDSD